MTVLLCILASILELQIVDNLLAKSTRLLSAALFCATSLCRVSALIHQIEESTVDVGRRWGKIGPAQPEEQISEDTDSPMPTIILRKREEGQFRTSVGKIDNSR